MPEVASQMKGDFATLERGYELAPFEFRVSAAEVQAYLDATGEVNELWDHSVPPLALGALALGGLMARFETPPGLVHTGQEFDFTGDVAIDETVEVRIVVASGSERRGVLMVVFETEVQTADAQIGRGRTSVMLVPEGLEMELS